LEKQVNHNLAFNTRELRAYLRTYTDRRGTVYYNAIKGDVTTFETEGEALHDIHHTLKVLDANYGDRSETLRTLWQAHINPAPMSSNTLNFQELKRRKAQN
jgi:hypothetical protein